MAVADDGAVADDAASGSRTDVAEGGVAVGGGAQGVAVQIGGAAGEARRQPQLAGDLARLAVVGDDGPQLQVVVGEQGLQAGQLLVVHGATTQLHGHPAVVEKAALLLQLAAQWFVDGKVRVVVDPDEQAVADAFDVDLSCHLCPIVSWLARIWGVSFNTTGLNC